MRLTQPKLLYPLTSLVLLTTLYLYCRETAARTIVSEFGKYHGYSEAVYNGTRRFSDYLELSDGTKLAYDLILPAKEGVAGEPPLPVLFKYTPYTRTFTIFDKNGRNLIAELRGISWIEKAYLRVRYWIHPGGNLMDPVFRTKWLAEMLASGYAVIVVERPGTGASFGKMDPSFAAMAREANEILNWIAAQTWCDGNIGMFGDSWQAQIQFAAASTANPHLKAIFPASTWMDNYSAVLYPGGIGNKAFAEFFIWSQKLLNSDIITPVDRDRDGTMLAAARAERGETTVAAKMAPFFTQFPFRDSPTAEGKRIWMDDSALFSQMDRINQSGIPVYLTNSWFDLFTRDNFLIYAGLTVPKRLIVRPLDHSRVEEKEADIDYAAEARRWFDYWLKGIKNGIMDEPPIHYYLMGADRKEAWNATDVWPLKNQEAARFYFGPGELKSKGSANGGRLGFSSPAAPEAADSCKVDYTTTTGKNSRWTAVNWAHKYPDMRTNDAKTLTFTTLPLETPLQVTGHPVVHLWLASEASDLDVFVYLEEVDEKGRSKYITEGSLRASHRVLGRAPYENFGLPYHNHFKNEMTMIPSGEAVELNFDLLPTAYLFSKGRQIRVTVAFADWDNFDTSVINPPPQVRLFRDKGHPSFVELPVVQSR